jgi:hypothetical protein
LFQTVGKIVHDSDCSEWVNGRQRRSHGELGKIIVMLRGLHGKKEPLKKEYLEARGV